MDRRDIRVLLLENVASDAQAIEHALRSSSHNFRVSVICSLQEYRTSVSTAAPDVALIDIMADGCTPEVLSSAEGERSFPILVLASREDDQTSLQALNAGAIDCVVKSPQAFAAMPRILDRALSRWQLMRERKQADEARNVVEHDFRLLADYHRQINNISISLIEASDNRELFNRTAESFRLLTGAVAATFSLYNSETRDLQAMSLSVDPALQHKADAIFGPGLFEIRMPISEEIEGQLLSHVIRRAKNLYDLSSGLMSRDISDAATDATGCRQIIALAINYAAELVGTCVAYLPGERQAIPDGPLITYAYIAGLAIRRRLAEQTLMESEEKYRGILEQMNEAYYELDLVGNITFFNDALCRQLGYSKEELLGFNYEVYVAPEDIKRVIEAHQAIINLGMPVNRMPLINIRKDGTRIFVEDSIFPVRNEKGEISGLRGISLDNTYRKRLEDEQQRVARLESVGLLAGGIAHDFNNILTAILGNISLASMEAAPGSEICESLEQAEKATLRARDLTQQLLTFAKGRDPVKKVTSLKDLLKDTASFALRGSNIRCQFSIPVDLWNAEIDAGQVSQVIHNLVINAQQAMPAGGTIDLRAENMALSETRSLGMSLPLKEGDYVRITVADRGGGIPAEHLDKIFEPFFTTKQKGSGLGLATSFSIARSHGGHLSVESETGSGSTFYLYLPASRDKTAGVQDKKDDFRPEAGASVLVTDDEELVREVAGRMLRHIGYQQVEFAADGAEAVRLYRAAMESGRPFSAVILDLTIAGGMGGRETLGQLLQVDPGVKAIVSSGYANEAVMAQYRDYGFSGMVAKPYTIARLRQALREVTV